MSVTQIQTSGITNDAITIDKITFENSLVPVGGIIMWNGSVAPTGWALCNGQNGTPDLRDRFIVGAGSAYNTGDTGGQNTVTLTESQMPSHSHTNGQGGGGVWFMNPAYRGPGIDYVRTLGTANTGSAGGGEAHENRPPYYALAFIMRVS